MKRYEVWQEEFTISIMEFKGTALIGTTLASISFDDDPADISEKLRLAHIMCNALNASEPEQQPNND